jgi:hypothetical protein
MVATRTPKPPPELLRMAAGRVIDGLMAPALAFPRCAS